MIAATPGRGADSGSGRSRCGPAQGYMLLELLVVAAMVCTLLVILLRFCATAQNCVRTQGDLTDLQQRLRVAVEAIRRLEVLADLPSPARVCPTDSHAVR